MRCGRGLSTVLHPSSPARPQGAGATYRSARPPGATARPGWVRRALSLGRKRNRWTVGARSLATSSAENGGRRGRAGAGAERRGARGRWGRNLPNSRARLRGGPGKQAGEQPAGAALLEWGDGGAPCPRASTIVWASWSPLAPPPRLSAPHPACLSPGEKGGGGSRRVKRVWGGWGFGVRRSEVGAGEGEVSAEWGRGQVTAGGGGKAREDRWGGRKWEGSPRRRERMEWLGGGL